MRSTPAGKEIRPRKYVEKRYAAKLISGDGGRVGYLLKDRVAQVGEFLDALDRVGAGGAAFDPEVVRRLVARTSHEDALGRLTPREREVLEKMAQGHPNAIFDKLDLPRAAGYGRRVLAVLRYLGS
jgi:hypothetical protein